MPKFRLIRFQSNKTKRFPLYLGDIYIESANQTLFNELFSTIFEKRPGTFL